MTLRAPPRIVLVRPSNPENLGAVARAMRNFGLDDWAIVALGTHDFATARRVAVHAEELLDRPRLCATLDEAVADCAWVVGTTSRAVRGRRRLAPEEVARVALERAGRTALVFGSERSGLDAAALDRCHDVSAVPTDAAQPSLNLAQAVLVYAYALRAAALAADVADAAPRAAAGVRRRARGRRGGAPHRAARWRLPRRARATRGARPRRDAPPRAALAPRGAALDGGAAPARARAGRPVGARSRAGEETAGSEPACSAPPPDHLLGCSVPPAIAALVTLRCVRVRGESRVRGSASGARRAVAGDQAAAARSAAPSWGVRRAIRADARWWRREGSVPSAPRLRGAKVREHTMPSSQPDIPPHAPLDLDVALAASRGDAAAVAALARRCRPLLAAHARRALGRDARRLDASDVVDEVVAEVEAFLAAGAPGDTRPGWRRFDPSRTRGGVEAWLYGIVRNKVRRRLRDARRRADASAAVAAVALPAPDLAHVERALDGAKALRLVSALPPRERAALGLWLADASSRDIAARLRFASPHAVDCCLARGKGRLRKLLLAERPCEEPPRAA